MTTVVMVFESSAESDTGAVVVRGCCSLFWWVDLAMVVTVGLWWVAMGSALSVPG